MPYSHLRWWRIGSAIVVAMLWLGLVLDVTGGDVDVWTVLRPVALTLVMWAAFWNSSAPLVRNARRRRAREAARGRPR